MIGVDDAKFSPLDDKVCAWNDVGNVLVFVPINNGICTKAPVDEALNYPYGVLITEITEFIAVSTGMDLNLNPDIYGLVGMLYVSVDRRGITNCGLDNNFMVNKDLHEVC